MSGKKVSFNGYVNVRFYCPPLEPIYTVCNENKSPHLQIKIKKLSVDAKSYMIEDKKIKSK